jgi:hypothetical protein
MLIRPESAMSRPRLFDRARSAVVLSLVPIAACTNEAADPVTVSP